MHAHTTALVLIAGAGLFASGCLSAASDPLPRATVHIRGTVEDYTGHVLMVETALGPVAVEFLPLSRVTIVVASDRGHLKDGAYLGMTSIAQPDGSLRATEVHIFPPGALRSGEGSYAWDLASLDAGGRKMTNGTTMHAALHPAMIPAGMHGDGTSDEIRTTRSNAPRRDGGTSLTLQFKSAVMTSPQALLIGWDVPIVLFETGRTWDVKPGAHVVVIATRNPDGKLCVDRILIGKNGLVPSL